jgi:methylated-DNA-[protein]-cysteine S-methyltransferase
VNQTPEPGGWKFALETALDQRDGSSLCSLASAQPAKVLRFLIGRLYTAADGSREKVVWALGALAGEPELLGEEKVRDLLRRFFWWLNDESGVVPFGIPEAIGAMLAARPELQPEFLPLICSMAHDPGLFQTGPIERGVFWALGHIGRPAALCSPDAVKTIAYAAQQHSDPQTRTTAAWALSRMQEF